MPCDACTKLGEIKCKQLICTSWVQKKQSTQTKPSSSGQTCLAGDQIQPRHPTAKWILVSPDLTAYAECYDRHHKSPGRPRDWEVWMQKRNEAPGPGHSLGRRALPPQGVVMCTPGKGRMPPNHPTRQPGHCRLCVSFFVYELSGSKVSSTECIRLRAVIGHVRHTVGSARI